MPNRLQSDADRLAETSAARLLAGAGELDAAPTCARPEMGVLLLRWLRLSALAR